MYTLNHSYTNDESLTDWLESSEFSSKKRCLVQIFYGEPDENKIKNITSIVHKKLPDANVIGTTTDGEIINDTVTTHKIIISATLFEKSTIQSAAVSFETNSYDMGCEIAKKLYRDDAKVMILFTTGLSLNGDEFLKGVKSVLKKGCIVSGGMAGDNGTFVQTYVSHQNSVLKQGVVGAVLCGEELYSKSQYQLGWRAVGLPMTVTKSEDNRVYEIDKKPIITVYEKYFGETVSNKLPKIGIEIPLMIEKNGLKIARGCIKRFDDGSLLFAGNVQEGEIVHFGIGSIDMILKETATVCIDFMKSFTPETVFIYSCMARRRLLKNETSFELKRLTKKCSVTGFFGNAEFYSDHGECFLFNETMTVLALSESDEKDVNFQADIVEGSEEVVEYNETRNALTHMTNVIAAEWQARVNEEIEKNEERSRESFQKNKLMQMGEMIGMIAHQWRQPLNAISATGIKLALLSSMGKLEDEKVQESSEFIQQQCQKMSQTIDTFMNFVKPDQQSKAFKISDMLKSIMQIMGTQLSSHSIKVDIKTVNEDISVVGYEDLLEQVLINILSNSRDAFDEIESSSKYININVDMKDGQPIIVIEDNAGGIKEEVRDKIFNPYFTTKEQGKGKGIGLYMSMDIMKQSFKGNIVYKAIENGSRFEVLFNIEN